MQSENDLLLHNSCSTIAVAGTSYLAGWYCCTQAKFWISPFMIFLLAACIILSGTIKTAQSLENFSFSFFLLYICVYVFVYMRVCVCLCVLAM